MDKNVFRALEKRCAEIEKDYGSLENFVINSTFAGEKHRMRMEESFFSANQTLLQVYQELSALEFADLVDYKNLAGLFDGEYS